MLREKIIKVLGDDLPWLETDLGELADKIIVQIKSEILEKLPQEMKFVDSEKGCGCGMCNQIEMFNECLSQVKKVVDDL